ncbi:hypothetical protein TorRG33x02_211820 [Trema orientale]|uniref:Uncharacterized protein n=1 Tax=Trema orientale TaxID=63057 RepID=A0A2P5EC10_TREOI|nr:hypothetical protein TorRG33x02_211820 [Trema orientale]
MLQCSNPGSILALSTNENDGVEDATVIVLHVNDDEVVVEASDISKSGAEVEEEETVHGFADMEEELRFCEQRRRRRENPS